MDNDLTLAKILEMRAEGRLFAELEPGRQYVLMAYELFPNGTTGDVFVQDQAVAAAIGERMGIGRPTDPMGWGIWEVPASRPGT